MTRTDDEPPEWARERARELMATEDEGVGESVEDREIGADTPDEEGTGRVPDVPREVVEEAERLTRLARDAVDPAATEGYRDRRDELVTDHEYTPRLREEDDTLVLYPEEWMESGTVQLDRVEDTDRAVEVSLSGPGDADRYREVAAYNDAVVDAVAERAGGVHAETARSFAAFMSNHYVRAVDDATPEMRAEFREEFFPRNAWPTDEQRTALEESLETIERVAAALDEPAP
ncbi:hypothetical protein DQW50_13505 [Halorubrum sp. 48-1-W]|uniref:DUF7108 domain-containing protein n=1 Tax=Halorubrum sp. 48-1-W TaxID=2249761 RepID=UPI000DCB02ED|nr:hypothetical protein [Halorubrum sp. 48-1-W]RAW44642.1 hypothetical protein DQW50_13505 [Halorubrum sp. 48-1-W]